MRHGIKTAVFIAILIVTFRVALSQNNETDNTSIVILDVEGDIDYARSGWSKEQALLPGALISPGDIIYPVDASLVVICPDGILKEFLSSELFSNDIIHCETDPGKYFLGNPGMQHLRIQRGGSQDATIPYVISPRATALRTNQVTVKWNPVLDVRHYTLILRAEDEVIWASDPLLPDQVVITGQSMASITLPIFLHENLSYTVEICVLFNNHPERCTLDPTWSSAISIGFRYVPNADIDERLVTTSATLGNNTPQTLFAQAVLLSQAIPEFDRADDPYGYYDEAISRLEQLQEEFPDSALARSPEFHIRLADLYRYVNLPLYATRVYNRAMELSEDGTEASAVAAVGRAMTTIAGDEVDFYNHALDSYAMILTAGAFRDQFQSLCSSIGDICLDLNYCDEEWAECSTWFNASE